MSPEFEGGSNLKAKSKKLALDVIAKYDNLPQSKAGSVIARQVLRSATSVGANYRSACRARSKAEMISKLNIALEEADETLYWFELTEESGLLSRSEIRTLMADADEVIRMLVASICTLKGIKPTAPDDNLAITKL